jgi:hypothetical protein
VKTAGKNLRENPHGMFPMRCSNPAHKLGQGLSPDFHQ